MTKSRKLERLEIRITKEEKERWQKLARDDNSNMSHWTRHVIAMALNQLSEEIAQKNVKFKSLNRPDETKTEAIKVYLTSSEAKALDEVIATKQMTRQQLIVKLIRSFLIGNAILDKEDTKTLVNANSQLRSVGINLNQIAHAINAKADDLDDNLVSESLKTIRNTSAAIDKQIKATSDFLRQCNARNRITVD